MKRYKKPGPRHRHFLREWREARGMKMIEVSRAIGLSNSTLSRIEKGQSPYYQDVVEAYAELFQIPPAALLLRTPARPKTSSRYGIGCARIGAMPPLRCSGR